MQGQKGAIDSSQEGLPLEHGSTSSDLGVVEQLCWVNRVLPPVWVLKLPLHENLDPAYNWCHRLIGHHPYHHLPHLKQTV